MPPTAHAFVVRRLDDGPPWVIGRAGMRYRDLIPGRLGGSIIASHIRIPDAGPVPDMVHYHTVGFQLIFCYHGWVGWCTRIKGRRSSWARAIASSSRRRFGTACSRRPRTSR